MVMAVLPEDACWSLQDDAPLLKPLVRELGTAKSH
jgi:hypothetical protein